MIHMKRILVFCLFSAVIAVGLIGCGKSDSVSTIDITELGHILTENIEFEDELNIIDDSTAVKLYNIDDFTKSQVYVSSGATSEEIGIFEFDSVEKAKHGFDMAKSRIEEQKSAFELYVPQEVMRLEDAIVKRWGRYVITCVCDDSVAAERIIARYLK